MTNLEYIISDEWRENLIKILKNNIGVRKSDGAPIRCEATNCSDCKFCGQPCVEVIEGWLNQKYQESLPFPIGTVIEAEDFWKNVVICYYNGINDGIHTGVYCKKSIGTNKGFTIDINTARKVGECDAETID